MNSAFIFHCTCVSATPLTWPKQHNWLTSPVGTIEWWSLIVVQASSCGSGKHKMLTYLAKNNISGIIQAVSDENKRKESEYWNILSANGVGRQLFKMKYSEEQNSNLIVRREDKYEKINYFLQWASWIYGPWQHDSKAESNKQLRHVRPSAVSQVTPNGQIFDLFRILNFH